MNNILIPRNIEGRREKLRQMNIQLLSKEVIEGDLEIDESFEAIDKELIKVKEIKGNVRLTINKSYIPSWLKDVKISGDFYCSFNKLTSLENCPKYVGGNFLCSNNKLTYLEGCPEHIDGSFYCYNNNLTSLKGCPKYVGQSFDCSYNKLTSLKGCPKKINRSFCINNNNLKTLKYCPIFIGGSIQCWNNEKLLEYDKNKKYIKILKGEIIVYDNLINLFNI